MGSESNDMMRRVMLIDDDPTFVRLAAHYLERAGFAAESYGDAMSALRMAFADPPALILADIRMPGLDGFGLLAALRAQPSTAAVPVILVTAVGDRQAQRRGMREGADDFLVKPVTKEELLEAVHTRLARAEAQSRPAIRKTTERGFDTAATTSSPPDQQPMGMPHPTLPGIVSRALAEVERAHGFRVLKQLGGSPRAPLYLVRVVATGIPVALRLLLPDRDFDGQLLHRFTAEQALLENLSSRHVARTLAHGITDDYSYLATEFFAAGNLRGLMAHRLDPQRALDLICEAALGVAHLHVNHIVHRNLKPENLLVRESGRLAVADIGSAADLASAANASGTGHDTTRASSPYLAPEQMRGRSPGTAADVYSLGAIWIELLTGYLFVPRKPGDAPRRAAISQVETDAPALGNELAQFQVMADDLLARDPAVRLPAADAALKRFMMLRDELYPQASMLNITLPLPKLAPDAMPVVPIDVAAPAQPPTITIGATSRAT